MSQSSPVDSDLGVERGDGPVDGGPAPGEAGLGAGRELEADEVLVGAEGFIVIHQTHPAAPVPAARLPLDDCLIRWNVVFISPSDNRNTFPFLASRPRFILLCIVY